MAAKSPTDQDLAARVADLEKKLVTRERVEEIAAAAALDVLKFYESEVKKATQAAEEMTGALEKREFARRVAASFEDRACRRSLDELVVEVAQDEVQRALQEKVADAIAERIEDPEFAEKLKGPAGASEEISKQLEGASKRLAERLDRIEQEALPQLVEELLGKRLDEKLDQKLDDKLDADALEQKVIEAAKGAVRDIANIPEFKAMLDEKFKVMMNYLAKDVIPKQIKRMTGG